MYSVDAPRTAANRNSCSRPDAISSSRGTGRCGRAGVRAIGSTTAGRGDSDGVDGNVAVSADSGPGGGMDTPGASIG